MWNNFLIIKVFCCREIEIRCRCIIPWRNRFRSFHMWIIKLEIIYNLMLKLNQTSLIIKCLYLTDILFRLIKVINANQICLISNKLNLVYNNMFNPILQNSNNQLHNLKGSQSILCIYKLKNRGEWDKIKRELIFIIVPKK